MHEAALFRDLRRALEDVARRERAERVVRARIWIGALSHVTEPRLRDAWPAIVAGGPAEGAELLVTVSGDLDHPEAARVVLGSIDV